MRQKCAKLGLVLLGFREKRNVPTSVKNESNMRLKCVKNVRNTFGGEHLLDDTEQDA